MKSKGYIISSLLIVLLFPSCEKGKNIDTEKPLIDISSKESFPKNCDTLYFGEVFELKVLFADNEQLGSYSLGIHHNFDHHSHSTEVSECALQPIKNPINPFTFIEDYDIPKEQRDYKTNLSVFIPSGNTQGLYEEGDYHFFISLTDHEGWSAQKGLSIKMLHR